jgi:hypothetical protein
MKLQNYLHYIYWFLLTRLKTLTLYYGLQVVFRRYKNGKHGLS